MLSRLNALLLTVLALLLVLLALVRVDHSRPNYQVVLGDDMTYSPAYTSYSPNNNFPDGRTLQLPVAGTLARGEQRLSFAATPEDALRAGEELANPHQPDSAERVTSADRGAVFFQTMCVACHAADGAGNGPVAQRGFPPPPSLLTGKTLEMKDGQLFHILSYGQNSMPSFATQLSADRRWDVVNYVRRMQQAAAAAPPAAAPEAQAATQPQPAKQESPKP